MASYLEERAELVIQIHVDNCIIVNLFIQHVYCTYCVPAAVLGSDQNKTWFYETWDSVEGDSKQVRDMLGWDRC